MAEILVTQTELDSYLASIDLNDATNSRIFNTIQLLSPNLFNDLLYYLIGGKITLAQLAGISLNNASVTILINTVSAANDTTLSKKKFYQNYLNTQAAFVSHNQAMSSMSGEFLANFTKPSSLFKNTVSIDTLGLDSAKYSNLGTARSAYNTVVAASRMTAAYTALSNSATANGCQNLKNLMNVEINKYGLLETSDNQIKRDLSPDASLVGYVLRNMFVYAVRMNYLRNLDFVLTFMAGVYTSDIPKNGVLGVRAGWNTTTWPRMIAMTTAPYVIKTIGETAMIRSVIPNIYGSTYFTQDELTSEQNLLNSIVYNANSPTSSFLAIMKIYLDQLVANLKTNMVVA